MLKKIISISILILSILAVSACNLPERQISKVATSTSSGSSINASLPTPSPVPSPTPASICNNPYFPSKLGTAWEYSGSNTASGAYNRTDTISRSSVEAFSVDTSLAGLSYNVNYSCSSAGLTANDPIQQYLGALLSSPNSPISLKLTSVEGITLPAKIAPGDTWQQIAGFEASSPQLNGSGRLVFDYTAVGYENVTVPGGTFNALRVDATIHIQVSAFHIEAGTYTLSNWLAPDVGLIKSEGTSHVPQIDFSDSMQLTSFTPAP